jgi:PIN domain nuclease of toxin-antitoxin system
MGGVDVIVLDTHVLVWADNDERKLGRKARALIDKLWAAGKVGVASISFWEVGLLAQRGRLRLPAQVSEWRNAILAAGAIELPLDGAVALRALDLSGLHDDPADRFIAATALMHGAALMTADERLLEWRHTLPRHDARV